MKKLIQLIALSLVTFNLVGQSVQSDIKVLKSVADNILKNTTYDFYNPVTDEVIKEVNEKNYSSDIKIRSPYNDWRYWNGVLNIAFMQMGEYFDSQEYKDFAIKNYEFAFKNTPIFEKYFREDMRRQPQPFGCKIKTEQLDDCGALGGGLIEVYKEDKKPEYRDYIFNTAADHIMNRQVRLDDGTLVRGYPHEFTLWADDLYMSIVFLSRMGDLTGENKYFDDAARQVVNFTKYLFNPYKELYNHYWYSDLDQKGIAYWGRCNGWVMLAQSDLLTYLPDNHPKRDTLISIFYQQLLGLAKYQNPSGLWHQLLDKNNSYLETSCTAMFTYSIAKAVNEGWIDERYRPIAEMGWEGLKSKIQADGKVEAINKGTSVRNYVEYYYTRPTGLNDIHGLGPVLMAGVEVIKMKEAD